MNMILCKPVNSVKHRARHQLNKMKYAKSMTLAIGLLLIFTACAAKLNNLSPAYLKSGPFVQSYNDPSSDITEYKTFSVFPISLIENENDIKDDVVERQMLFALRNAFEELGYKFVELDDSPDFLAMLDASAKASETYSIPHVPDIPYWIPGQTSKLYGRISGTFNYNTYDSYSSYEWGKFTSSSNSKSPLSGEIVKADNYSASIVQTAKNSRKFTYYPTIIVHVFDGKSLRNVWAGTGIGASDNPDIRVSSQFVLKKVVHKFPYCHYFRDSFSMNNTGQLGLNCWIYTNNGNIYYPTVVKLEPKMPAEQAGIKTGDMIIIIDGISTIDKPMPEILKLLSGSAGSSVNLSISRADEEVINLSLKRYLRPE